MNVVVDGTSVSVRMVLTVARTSLCANVENKDNSFVEPGRLPLLLGLTPMERGGDRRFIRVLLPYRMGAPPNTKYLQDVGCEILPVDAAAEKTIELFWPHPC